MKKEGHIVGDAVMHDAMMMRMHVTCNRIIIWLVFRSGPKVKTFKRFSTFKYL